MRVSRAILERPSVCWRRRRRGGDRGL